MTQTPPSALRNILNDATSALQNNGCPTPALDAEVLLAHILDITREKLLASTDEILGPADINAYKRAIEKRLAHMPVAYITGRKEFYGLPFLVTPDVMIPRPETERLVDLVLENDFTHLYDIGTGSGCVAIALKLQRPKAFVTGIDISDEICDIARTNAALLRADVSFRKGSLADKIDKNVDTIVANLPYLPLDLDDRSPETLHEPQHALFGGSVGDELIMALLADIKKHALTPQRIYLEIDPHYCDALSQKLTSDFDIARHHEGRFLTLRPR